MSSRWLLIVSGLCFGLVVSPVWGSRVVPLGDPVPGTHGHGKPSDEPGMAAAPPIQAMVATEAGVVYAGSFGMGVFRSDDQGQHWEPVNTGLRDLFILSLAAEPGGVVYAGTVMGGVFRTTEGGKRWEQIRGGLKRVEVKSLLVHQSEVYAGTGRGVYRWEEASQRWHVVASGLDQILVSSVVMLGERVLLAGTAGKGLLKFDTSSPGLSRWTEVSKRDLVDPKEHLNHRYIRIVAVGGDDQVYVGTQDGGLFHSGDSGKSWHPLGRSLPNDSIRGILPIQSGLLAATGRGIFKLDPQTNKWVPHNTGLTELSIQVLIGSKEGPFYAGTSAGAFRSDDGGAHWVNVSQGFGVQANYPRPYF